MINANELRIGNWVNEIVLGNCIISGVDTSASWVHKEGEKRNYSINFQNLEPIPLDTSILEACGATGKYKSCGYVFRLNGVTLTTQDEDDEGNPIKDYVFHVHIDFAYEGIYYLHDLQNAIYALTKSELNIKL